MTAKARFLEIHGKKCGAVQAESHLENNVYLNVAVYEIKDAAKGCFVVSYVRYDRFYVELWRSHLVKNPETYCFNKPESRLAYVNRWIANQQRREAEKVASRKQRSEKGTGLQVGDVLSASWGYDQTNYNYYEVTKLVGKSMVEVRELAQYRQETEWLQGKCAPKAGDYISEPMRRKASNGYVKISDVIRAYKMEAKEIAGVKIYDAGHYTAYH